MRKDKELYSFLLKLAEEEDEHGRMMATIEAMVSEAARSPGVGREARRADQGEGGGPPRGLP